MTDTEHEASRPTYADEQAAIKMSEIPLVAEATTRTMVRLATQSLEDGRTAAILEIGRWAAAPFYGGGRELAASLTSLHLVNWMRAVQVDDLDLASERFPGVAKGRIIGEALDELAQHWHLLPAGGRLTVLAALCRRPPEDSPMYRFATIVDLHKQRRTVPGHHARNALDTKIGDALDNLVDWVEGR